MPAEGKEGERGVPSVLSLVHDGSREAGIPRSQDRPVMAIELLGRLAEDQD